MPFEDWLRLKGWDPARLHPRELNFLRGCWKAECPPPKAPGAIQTPAKPMIRAAAQDQPRAFRLAGNASIKAAEGEGKLPTFEGNAYTGAPMRPVGWWQPVVIDLDGVKVNGQTRPVLRQHDHEQILGHTTSVKVDGEGIKVAGVLSGQKEHIDKVTVPAANGFQWQLSVGANPVRTEFLESGETTTVNGREVTGPLTISRETEFGEVSFVPLGADDNTSATIAAQKGSPMNPFALSLKALMADLRARGKVQAAKYSDDEIDKMSADDCKAALKKAMKAADDEPDDDDKEKTEAARQAALKAAKETVEAMRREAAAEARRQAEITARVRTYQVTEIEIEISGQKKRVALIPHAIEAGWTADEAELYALRAARPGSGVGLPGGLGYSTSMPEVSEAVLEAAVFHAARHQFRLDDDDFYSDATPDGRGRVRRVPLYLERQARGGFQARYTDQVQQAAHTIFKGRIAPKQIVQACFRSHGREHGLDLSGEHGIRSMLAAWDHMEREQPIRAEGSSNLSISNVLANVLNKFALQGYLFVEQAWREFCAIRPVNDFKPSKSINLLGDVMFKVLGPTGEIENASLGDQAFANLAAPFARILTIPWTHLVNDDLGMLTGAPMKLGQGAGLALNDQVWTLVKNLIAGTVNGDDGIAFFRTTNSLTAAAKKAGTAYAPNKMTGGGSALSATSLQTARALFDNQVDPNGNPLGFDGMTPILLHGPTNWQTATALMQAAAIVYGGGSATLQPDKNVWQGQMKPVMSRYMENSNYVNSATAWLILYNPVALAVVEVAFLNGVDTPEVLTAGPDYQFDRLGISVRGTFPFGSNAQNFRGGVYSAGA